MLQCALVVVVLLAHVIAAADPEFEKVTCGSAIKLTNIQTNYKLHSHEIPYGSGSGQQSITGFPENNDPNSLFLVKNSFGEDCQRGEAIKCNSIIRLQHLNTGRNLHSHLHQSPISKNQEVSGYGSDGQGDSGDNWELQCTNAKDQYWKREAQVRLMHKDTGKFLTTMAAHKYSNPIPGQLEVFCVEGKNQYNLWAAQEGLYIGDKDYIY